MVGTVSDPHNLFSDILAGDYVSSVRVHRPSPIALTRVKPSVNTISLRLVAPKPDQ